MIYTDGVHLIADSVPELHAFADDIGLNHCWFRGWSKLRPHYSLINKKKAYLFDGRGEKYLYKAIRMGALKITSRELVRLLRLNYQFPTSEEEIKAWEEKHSWELSQPLSATELKKLDEMRERIINKIFPKTDV